MGRAAAWFLLLSIGWCGSLHAGEWIHVPGGDVSALIEAIETANDNGVETFIYLGDQFEFGPDTSLPPIAGNMWFMHARFVAVDGGPEQLVSIEPGGRLVLFGVEATGFSLDHGKPLMENHGSLIMGDVGFEHIVGRANASAAELISNHGTLEIDRTSFLQVGSPSKPGGIVTNRGGQVRLRSVVVADWPDASRLGGAFANLDGTLRMVNSTIQWRGTVVDTEPGARTELANMVIADPRDPRAVSCRGPVVSYGHNLVWDESCALNGPEDLQGVATGTLPLRLEGVSYRAARRPVIELAGASPAVDSGKAFFCDAVRQDVQGRYRPIDGDNDGVARCDRGAFELSQERLTGGAINGAYHVPDRDGHYISIFHTPNNALVIWNTFDRNGNPAWVFATGAVANGRSVLATAYANERGVLTDAGPVDAELANPWGTLLIELDSCDGGRVIFDSHRPEFGRGEFAIRRLASTRQLACVE